MPEKSVRHIPVRREGRTLEQRHKDLVSKLRQSTGRIQHDHGRKYMGELDWADDLSRWADWVFDCWNGEMRRLHEHALPLLPLDAFATTPGDIFAPHGDVGTILGRMNQQFEAMNRLMCSAMDQPMLPQSTHRGSQNALDYLRQAYEPAEDGQVHFKQRFNLQGYSPEDIEVKVSRHGLTVHAKKTDQSDTGSFSREYSRMIYLPDSVDTEHLQSHLSEDGILMIEAPLVPERQKSIKLGRDVHLGIKPSTADAADTSLALQPLNKPGLSIVPAGDTGQKLHLELAVEPDFTADDICVRVDGNRILISGRKELTEESANTRSTHVKEFTRSYEIPAPADTLAVSAQLDGSTLLVEAPLLSPAHSN